MPSNVSLTDRNIDTDSAHYRDLLAQLQGNILKGHGRERSAHIFLRFQGANRVAVADGLIAFVGKVTTMRKQLDDTQRFKKYGVPGDLFTTVALSAEGYAKLGLAVPSPDALFKSVMIASGPGLGDPPAGNLEDDYQPGGIDAVVMLADDDEGSLLREVGRRLDTLVVEPPAQPWATLVAVEIGRALRNEEGEGIEPFGFVDGRSQPLYLLADLCDEIDARTGANIDKYNPSEPLSRVLIADPLVTNLAGVNDACGSLMVFRKLEQNVQAFRMKEQELANKLGLTGPDRARAGAMVVGRFQDGTPLVLAQTDGLVPSKDNNFNFVGDAGGLKCPFQAHIRKVNPRGDFSGPDANGQVNAETERGRRITRRGIAYDDRPTTPTGRQTLEQLPTADVGLLFICFQASIVDQFAFMQAAWANNVGFAKQGTGIDPIIGQATNPPDQTWHPAYNGSTAAPTAVACKAPPAAPAAVPCGFSGFVKMRGGEFFFAPSVAFINKLAEIVAAPPAVVPTPTPTPPNNPGPNYTGALMGAGPWR